MMKKTLNESQLRNIVYKTIKESLLENDFNMYYIEDEGDGGIYGTTSDMEEAIANAKEMAMNGGHFLVKDKNDEIIFDTGGLSYKFESKEIVDKVMESIRKKIMKTK